MYLYPFVIDADHEFLDASWEPMNELSHLEFDQLQLMRMVHIVQVQ